MKYFIKQLKCKKDALYKYEKSSHDIPNQKQKIDNYQTIVIKTLDQKNFNDKNMNLIKNQKIED